MNSELCLDCGHTHECWCGGEKDEEWDDSACCQCDVDGHPELMSHPKRVDVKPPTD